MVHGYAELSSFGHSSPISDASLFLAPYLYSIQATLAAQGEQRVGFSSFGSGSGHVGTVLATYGSIQM